VEGEPRRAGVAPSVLVALTTYPVNSEGCRSVWSVTVKLNVVSCSFFANVSDTLGAMSPFTESAAFGVSDDGSVDNFDIWLLAAPAATARTITAGSGARGWREYFVPNAGSQQGLQGKACFCPGLYQMPKRSTYEAARVCNDGLRRHTDQAQEDAAKCLLP